MLVFEVLVGTVLLMSNEEIYLSHYMELKGHYKDDDDIDICDAIIA